MNHIRNTSFTRSGSSKRQSWSFIGLVLFAALLCSRNTCYAFRDADTVDSLTTVFRKADDVAGFTYACLDLYLKDPAESRLPVLDLYEKHCWRKASTADEYLANVILRCNKGFYLSRFGNIYEAIEAYEKAWETFQDKHLTGFDIIEYCLKPLGNNYSMLGDYTSAGNIIRSYLFLAEQQKNYAHIAGAVINLSIIYHDTGNPQAAIEVLQGIAGMKQIPAEKKALIHANLARNYEVVHALMQAQNYASLAIAYFEKHPASGTALQLVNVYKVLSLIQLHEKDTSQALLLLKKARSLADRNKQDFKARELAKLTLEYGNLLKLTAQYTEALIAYQQALQILLPSYKPANEESLPLVTSFYPENAIKEALDELADLYEKTDKPQLAINCYELSFTVEDQLRATYNYQNAKLQQQIENRDRAARVIRLLYALNQQTHDASYALRAFQVAERTKALTLKEMVEDRYARRFMQQDTLLKQESQLLFKQAMLTNELVLEQSKQPVNAAYINELISRQTRLTIRIKAVQRTIEQRYPSHTTASQAWPDIKQIQQKLDNDHATLVEYFTDKEVLYQFVLTDDLVSFYRIEKADEINKSILTLSDLFSDAAQINNNIESYKQTAYDLFRKLQLDRIGNATRLVLVADGLLNIIPVDALLYEEAVGIYYAAFPYLIKKYTVAYEPSASLYAHHHEPTAPMYNQTLLALFPVFENTPQALTYSLEEAESMQRHFTKGHYLLRDEATRQAFLDNAPYYSIIHLSTHAFPGDATEPPAIYFRDSVLYLPQIYGLQLKPDLMVLSACETGVGKLARGEGALSLAHGFQFAGIRNIILSLWKVNDQSTARLLSNFYRRYQGNGMKAEALQQAKVDYLRDENIQNMHKSPFYWAAFIYYGDYEALPREQGIFNLYALMIVFAGLGVIVVYVVRRKKR